MGDPFLSSVFLMYKSFISNLRLILPCVATSLGLTLLPICVSLLWVNSWPLQIRNLPLRSGCTYGLRYRLFHSSFCARSLSMPFRISLARACAPVSLASPCSINSCLLAGICLCTSLGVCGRCRIRTCVALVIRTIHKILCSRCLASRPIFQICRGLDV